MEFRVHNKLRSRIKDEQRDIALITAPGMGLSTLLGNLREIDNFPFAWLDITTLMRYWESEYKDRTRNRRYVLHAATIMALIQNRYADIAIGESDLYHTNLSKFMGEHLDNQAPVYVVIDGFSRLPSELAKIVLNEIKSISDQQTQDGFHAFSSVRFIVGGPIDFHSLFAQSGVSPATNFTKYRPYEFLLSDNEAGELLRQKYPNLVRFSNIVNFIIDWAEGYIHYVLAFARWVDEEIRDNEQPTISHLVQRLCEVITDGDRIELFKYCYDGWDVIKEDAALLGTALTAISTGFLHDNSDKGRKLAQLGFLLEKAGLKGQYRPSNKLIDLFLRQRLAEKGLLLPISDISLWALAGENAKTYTMLYEIENRLRAYIGDMMFAKHKTDWKSNGFNVLSAEGKNILDGTNSRMEDEQKSVFSRVDFPDPFLSFLDISDLRLIVQNNATCFPQRFAEKFPEFLDEINFLRRRIAHNRPVFVEQFDVLDSRWKIIQKMIAQQSR